MNPTPKNRAVTSQTPRTIVGSSSAFSGNPPQTPAIFLSFRDSVSGFFGAAAGVNIAVPQWQQKLTFWLYSFPQLGQYMTPPLPPGRGSNGGYPSAGQKVPGIYPQLPSKARLFPSQTLPFPNSPKPV